MARNWRTTARRIVPGAFLAALRSPHGTVSRGGEQGIWHGNGARGARGGDAEGFAGVASATPDAPARRSMRPVSRRPSCRCHLSRHAVTARRERRSDGGRGSPAPLPETAQRVPSRRRSPPGCRVGRAQGSCRGSGRRGVGIDPVASAAAAGNGSGHGAASCPRRAGSGPAIPIDRSGRSRRDPTPRSPAGSPDIAPSRGRNLAHPGSIPPNLRDSTMRINPALTLTIR